jgi:hypothetical protein
MEAKVDIFFLWLNRKIQKFQHEQLFICDYFPTKNGPELLPLTVA